MSALSLSAASFAVEDLDAIAAVAFDPQWNAEHRFEIWGLILGALFVSGAGIPLPEDIPLTIAGFTTYQQARGSALFPQLALSFAMVVTIILAGDLVAYGMGRRLGLGLRDRVRLFRHVLTDARMARVQRWFREYGSVAVFLGRQVAGLRFVTFFSAGMMRLPLWRFVLFDFLGCVVSVPVWMTLGVLASRYGAAWAQESSGRVALYLLLAVSVVALLLFGAKKLILSRRTIRS